MNSNIWQRLEQTDLVAVQHKKQGDLKIIIPPLPENLTEARILETKWGLIEKNQKIQVDVYKNYGPTEIFSSLMVIYQITAEALENIEKVPSIKQWGDWIFRKRDEYFDERHEKARLEHFEMLLYEQIDYGVIALSKNGDDLIDFPCDLKLADIGTWRELKYLLLRDIEYSVNWQSCHTCAWGGREWPERENFLINTLVFPNKDEILKNVKTVKVYQGWVFLPLSEYCGDNDAVNENVTVAVSDTDLKIFDQLNFKDIGTLKELEYLIKRRGLIITIEKNNNKNYNEENNYQWIEERLKYIAKFIR